MGTVHLIDDDASFLIGLTRLVTRAGFRVRTYSTAEEFLRQYQNEEAPGCIICDVEMPGMSGLELQVCLKETQSTLPVVFLSACSHERISRAAMKAGALDFVTKPVGAEQLVNVLNRALARALEEDAE